MFRHWKMGAFPIAAVALAAALNGCRAEAVTADGEMGRPLDELDLSGEPPSAVALMGPDRVRITPGERLAISLQGPDAAKAAMRFTLKDGALGVLRRPDATSGDPVTVLVTMPPPRRLTLAGSGTIESDAMASDKLRVTVAGSGTVEVLSLAAKSIRVEIAGSGAFRGAGDARSLKLRLAGTGTAEMDGLKVAEARVHIAGSGRGRFASDGTVDASIFGSGEVRVIGRATCRVNAVGSGRLVCEPGGDAAAA